MSLIILESVIRTEEKKYFPQTFLEECKYEEKNFKRYNRIEYDFDRSSSDESDSELDSEFESDNESEKSSKKSDYKESD